MGVKVAVIGAGTMGRGVAQVFAEHDYQVILVDIKNEILEEAKASIRQNVRMRKLFNKNLNLDDAHVIEQITFTTELSTVSDANFVVENIIESIEAKESLYKQLKEICNDDCIFMVNTSCISITKIGACMKDASKVIGTHFMNPVPMIDAVEVMRGFHTSDETVSKVKELLNSIDKEEIVIQDFPGFVTNRISHLMMNEAAFIVQDQVAKPEDVDKIFRKCYGHKMGPLETADLIGLDTVVDSLDVLYQSFQDTKFRCCPLLRKMVEAGLLGRKSGQGFYQY